MAMENNRAQQSEATGRPDAFDGTLRLEVLALLLALRESDLADLAGHSSGVIKHDFDLGLHVFDVGEQFVERIQFLFGFTVLGGSLHGRRHGVGDVDVFVHGGVLLD